MRPKSMKILLGNTFPLTLVKRVVEIEPISLDEAARLLDGGFDSFWGHTNTLAAAKEQLGVDPTPETERPSITLDEEGLPAVGQGESATVVVVLSPQYRQGFRPQIGEEVSPEDILGWQALKVQFL